MEQYEIVHLQKSIKELEPVDLRAWMSEFVINKHVNTDDNKKVYDIDLKNYSDKELRDMEKFIKNIKLNNGTKSNKKNKKDTNTKSENINTENKPEQLPIPVTVKKKALMFDSDDSLSSDDESESKSKE